MSEPESSWFEGGLRFSCTRCGACCTGRPGYVWVGPEEISCLAERLGLDPDQFGRRYLRRIGDKYSLIEKPTSDCVFWDSEAGCTVYESRPTQCRTWPFWPGNIEAPEDWERTKGGCPGAGQGRLYQVEEILASANRGPK